MKETSKLDDTLTYREASDLDCNDEDVARMGYTIPCEGGWKKPPQPINIRQAIFVWLEQNVEMPEAQRRAVADSLSGFLKRVELERNTRAESELLTAANEMEEALKDLIEHIDACNESDLLNCDDDPHPPSVFRCYADLAQAKLDRFRAMKPKGGER